MSGNSNSFSLEIPGTPPSLNTLSHAHWRKFQHAKQQWEGYCMIALLEARVPKKLNHVAASAELTFPQKRRRDEINFRTLLDKALGDTLICGWIADDVPEHFQFGEVTFNPETGTPLTVITLEVQLG